MALRLGIVDALGVLVSVPFTRGTPLWRQTTCETSSAGRFQSPSRGGRLCGGARCSIAANRTRCFSPLHEGDASVATVQICRNASQPPSFSPLHEGDASVARSITSSCPSRPIVSVPFTRGTPLWHARVMSQTCLWNGFQSPSRGGRLCGSQTSPTPPCRHPPPFQSPSRGGRLCGRAPGLSGEWE